MEDCSAKCLSLPNCAAFQRVALHNGTAPGVCWFDQAPQPSGHVLTVLKAGERIRQLDTKTVHIQELLGHNHRFRHFLAFRRYLIPSFPPSMIRVSG